MTNRDYVLKSDALKVAGRMFGLGMLVGAFLMLVGFTCGILR